MLSWARKVRPGEIIILTIKPDATGGCVRVLQGGVRPDALTVSLSLPSRSNIPLLYPQKHHLALPRIGHGASSSWTSQQKSCLTS